MKLKTNAPSIQTVALPTPRDIVESALHHYAVHVAQTAAEIAQACEALRLLNERPETADALFAPAFDAVPPVTDKQRDLLAKLGYKGELHNRGHASTLIGDMLDKRKHPTNAKPHTGKPQMGKRFAGENVANR